LGFVIWIVNEAQEVAGVEEVIEEEPDGQKKSGSKVVTLIATPNPVSQVLW
jgi:hypothetical protein